MPKSAMKKEKWTLSFDMRLKRLLTKEAKKRGVYPAALLEQLVREWFSPYGYTDVKQSVSYVRGLRKKSRNLSDAQFFQRIESARKSLKAGRGTKLEHLPD